MTSRPLRLNEPLFGDRGRSIDQRDDVRRSWLLLIEVLEDVQLVRSQADSLCDQFGLALVALSIHRAHVKWKLQGDGQRATLMDGFFLVSYLSNQFTSGASHLEYIWNHFISTGFELVSCPSTLTLLTNRLVVFIVARETLGFAGEGVRRQS